MVEKIILDENSYALKNPKSGKLALFNKKNIQITGYNFDKIEPLESDYIVEDGDYFGIIDANGKFLVSMIKAQKEIKLFETI